MAEIGAGTRIYMGDAAAPMNTANGGASSDADLDDVTQYLTGFSFSNPMGTVDVTTLKADIDAFTRRFIAGLRNATVSGNYIEDDAACAFFRRLDAISAGSNHTLGRGKVDFRVKVGGAVTGNTQIDGTIIITEGAGLSIEIETALGSSLSGQVDGQLTVSVQS